MALTDILTQPVAEETAKSKITNLLTKIRPIKALVEAPDNSALGVLKNTGIELANVGKDILRAPLRSLVSATSLLAGEPDSEVVPKTKTEKFLFGEEPIGSLSRRSSEARTTLESFGLSSTASKILAPAGIVATALDLVPGLGGQKALLKTLAKETSEAVISTLLKKQVKGISDEVVTILAPKIAKATDPKQIETLLKEAATPAQKLLSAIRAAKPEEKEIAKAQTAERAKRIAAATAAIVGKEGREAYFATLSKLKGELAPRAGKLGDVEKNLSGDDVTNLFNQVTAGTLPPDILFPGVTQEIQQKIAESQQAGQSVVEEGAPSTEVPTAEGTPEVPPELVELLAGVNAEGGEFIPPQEEVAAGLAATRGVAV